MLPSPGALALTTTEKEHGCTRKPSLQARRSHSRSAPAWFAGRASTAPGTAASTSAAAASALAAATSTTRSPTRASAPRAATSAATPASASASAISSTATSPSKALRSEEHTSELQSQSNLVCRLLLEKKNTVKQYN